MWGVMTVNFRGQDIFARKYVYKNQQNSRILHDISPKNIFPIFYGRGRQVPSPSPVSYAYHVLSFLVKKNENQSVFDGITKLRNLVANLVRTTHVYRYGYGWIVCTCSVILVFCYSARRWKSTPSTGSYRHRCVSVSVPTTSIVFAGKCSTKRAFFPSLTTAYGR